MSVKYAVLSVLGDAPLHGYAIQRALDDRLGLLWPVNHGQVYATLARLASEGLIRPAEVESASAPGEVDGLRRWELSPAGARRLADWRVRPAGRTEPRGELVTKLFFAAAVGGAAAVHRLAERQAARCAALARALREEEARLDANQAAVASARQARQAALALLEADLEWLALAAGELTRGPACGPRR